MSRQGVLLLFLMGFWAALIFWQWYMPNEPQRVPLTNVSGAKASRSEPAVPPEWVLNPPRGTRESPTIPKRNLFTSLNERQEQVMLATAKQVKRREDSRERTVLEAAPAGTRTSESAPAPPPPRVSPQEAAEMVARQEREQRIGKLREQAAQYRLLGLAEQSGVKQAFIGKGTDIYIVRQGDQLDGLFMVSIVDAGEVKIRDTEYHLEHTIKITKAEGP